MVLEIGGTKWFVHFHRHELTETELEELKVRQREAGHPNRLWDVDINCRIHSGPCVDSTTLPKHCVNGLPGVAHCSLKDQFERRAGHKKALERAIAALPRDTRKLIWDAYWLKTRRLKEDSLHFQRRIAATEPLQAQTGH